MAVTSKHQLQVEVLGFSLKPNQTLSQFSYPEYFEECCRNYLRCSPPDRDMQSQRFSTLNFDGFIAYNCLKGPLGYESEEPIYATEDVRNWKTAIKCLQRYCLNLLLAPKRRDFHQIKFSTGYYQYNIANNFKGAEKIFEVMGYGAVSYSGKAKETLVKMQLKEPKNLLDPKGRAKLAWVLVDLVLFDFELDILVKCISEYKKLKPGRDCTIMDAWKARKNTSGGVQNALGYLYNNLHSSEFTDKPSAANNMHGNNMRANNRSANQMPANNVTEDKPLDLSALPPPDHGEGDEFESVTQHINPSSHTDDDDNQLIKDSTQLGYRNPPEAKSHVKPSIQPRADPPGYLDGYRPSQHQHVDARGFGNEFHYGRTRSPNVVPAAAFPGDTAKPGGLHSLPSVTVSTSTNANQFGSSPRVYKRQASIPNDTSLSGSSERIAGIATGTTTNSNQLAVSDSSPVIAAVPITDQPTPEVSQAPPDSKYGKTNLNVLKNRLQHKKEVTQTVFQTSSGGAGPHSQSTSDYVNAEIPYQGVSDSTTKPVAGKADLTSLRNKLEKSKEEREKTLTASKNANDYCNFTEISAYISENRVMINNPPNKRPIAGPRTVTPASHASNDTHSASSTSSSKVPYQLWQCAYCQTVNKAHHTACEHCKLPKGKLADRSYLCNFCQMMIFIPTKRDFKDTCCPRCKHVYESAC